MKEVEVESPEPIITEEPVETEELEITSQTEIEEVTEESNIPVEGDLVKIVDKSQIVIADSKQFPIIPVALITGGTLIIITLIIVIARRYE